MNHDRLSGGVADSFAKRHFYHLKNLSKALHQVKSLLTCQLHFAPVLE
jgi:hypothetical protein